MVKFIRILFSLSFTLFSISASTFGSLGCENEGCENRHWWWEGVWFHIQGQGWKGKLFQGQGRTRFGSEGVGTKTKNLVL